MCHHREIAAVAPLLRQKASSFAEASAGRVGAAGRSLAMTEPDPSSLTRPPSFLRASAGGLRLRRGYGATGLPRGEAGSNELEIAVTRIIDRAREARARRDAGGPRDPEAYRRRMSQGLADGTRPPGSMHRAPENQRDLDLRPSFF